MHRTGKIQYIQRGPAARARRIQSIRAGNRRIADTIAQLERLRGGVIIVSPLFAGVTDGDALKRTEGIILKAHTVSQAASGTRSQRTQGALSVNARSKTIEGPASRSAGAGVIARQRADSPIGVP